MPEGILKLSQVAVRIHLLDVVCARCDRRGCLSTARLLAEHGPDLPMPELLSRLTENCDRRKGGSMYNACGAHFPQLPVLFRA
ncbi:MAG: hypothetical protein JO042_16210 [Sinobacteraceae bacterium]|nr:hypothetical protein [Nevskiaceae bacterium]